VPTTGAGPCRRPLPTSYMRLAAPTTPSCTAAVLSSGFAATTSSSMTSGRRCRPVPHAITACRSRLSSSATATISIRSIRCCLALPRWSFTIYGPAAAMRLAGSTPMCCGARSLRDCSDHHVGLTLDAHKNSAAMRIAILSTGTGWHVKDLQRAAAALGHEATAVDFRKIGSGAAVDADSLAGFETVLVRTMPPGSLEQVVFRMDLLHSLQARGVTVLNPPAAVEACVDKYLATARLEAAGLKVPPTIVCQHAEAALQA